MTDIQTLKSQQIKYVNKLIHSYNSTKNTAVISASSITKDLLSALDQIEALNNDIQHVQDLISQNDDKAKITFDAITTEKIRHVIGEATRTVFHTFYHNRLKLFTDYQYDERAHKDSMVKFFRHFIKESNVSTRDSFDSMKKSFPDIMKDVKYDELPDLINKIQQAVNEQKSILQGAKEKFEKLSTDDLLLKTLKLRNITRHNEIIASVNMPNLEGQILLSYSPKPEFAVKKGLKHIFISGDYRGDICITDGSTHENSAQINGVAQGGQKTLSYNQYKDGIAFSGNSDIFYVSAVSRQQGYEIHKDTQFLAIK